MREKDLKALVHGALAVVGLIEAFDCRSKTRKILTGALVGWHLNATFYHLFLEKEDEIKLDKE